VRKTVPASVDGSSAAAAGQAAAAAHHAAVQMVRKWLVYLRTSDALCVSWLDVAHMLAVADTTNCITTHACVVYVCISHWRRPVLHCSTCNAPQSLLPLPLLSCCGCRGILGMQGASGTTAP
jgi:hypothetical protein